MISSILSLFLISTINIQNHSSDLKHENVVDSTGFIVVDTIDFEGLMIMDAVNGECYFIDSDRIKKIRLKYKSNDRFKKEFKDKEKMNFIQPTTFKALLFENSGINLPEDQFWLHHPRINGNSVYTSDNNAEIYISLYNGRLVKTQISLEILKGDNIPYIENGEKEEFVYFYSFL